MSRLSRGLTEKIYLINATHSKDLNQWDFKVRGKSKNIYNQIFTENMYSCSCPDHKTRKSFCKHLIFLVARVANKMKIAENISYLDYKWTKDTYNVCHKSWLSRLSKRTINKNNKNNEKDEEKMKDIQAKALGEDCPICYEEMNDVNTLYKCNTCKNYFHNDCINTWMSSGYDTCPLCRSKLLDNNSNSNSIIENENTFKLNVLP